MFYTVPAEVVQKVQNGLTKRAIESDRFASNLLSDINLKEDNLASSKKTLRLRSVSVRDELDRIIEDLDSEEDKDLLRTPGNAENLHALSSEVADAQKAVQNAYRIANAYLDSQA